MGKIQELYDTRVRPMMPAERLQLARLILNDLGTLESGVDTSDDRSDEDMADVANYSATHVIQSASAPG